MARAKDPYRPSHPAADQYANKRQNDELKRSFRQQDKKLATLEDRAADIESDIEALDAVSNAGLWEPDAAPESPHEFDEEFTGDTMPSGWADWDVDGTMTATFENSHLIMRQTSAAGDQWAGIYRSLPASGQFLVTAKIAVFGRESNYSVGGIGLAHGDLGAAPSTVDLLTFNHTYVSAAPFHTLQLSRWDDYQTFGADLITAQNTRNPGALWLRMLVDVDADTCQVWWSRDGIGFSRRGSSFTMPAAADAVHFFVGINNNGSGGDVLVMCDYVRWVETTDPYVMLEGRLV